MKPQKATRDASIELYRVFLMLLICLLHSFQFGLAPNKYWASGLMWSVCGFVFISGWFGIKFSFSKWLRLLSMGLICGGIAIAIGWCLDIHISSKDAAYILARQWFLCAYLMLMLLAPFLNAAFEQMKLSVAKWGGLVLPLCIIIVWNWLGNVKPWFGYGPYTLGMGAFTFLIMLTVYSLGRIVRIKYDGRSSKTNVPTLKLCLAAVVNLLILVCGWRLRLGAYCSPFAMSMSVLVFFLFKRISVPHLLAKVILFIAPSMFSIYLLHAHVVGAVCIKRMQNLCVTTGLPQSVFIPLSAVAVFSACLMLDLIRRAVAHPFNNRLQRLYMLVESKLEDTVSFIGSALKS